MNSITKHPEIDREICYLRRHLMTINEERKMAEECLNRIEELLRQPPQERGGDDG